MTDDSDLQANIFREFLRTNIRSNMKGCTKPQHDEILNFVMKYFGREMKGETDRAEFKRIIELISKAREVPE